MNQINKTNQINQTNQIDQTNQMNKTGHERSTVVLGTRGSKLAVQQSEWVQAQLHALAPHVTVTLRMIQTSGDKILDVPLAQIGGKGLFVKEIE